MSDGPERIADRMIGIEQIGGVVFSVSGERLFFSAIGPSNDRGVARSRIGLCHWGSGHWRWLTDGTAWDFQPLPSPEGERLLFFRRRAQGLSLAILPLDGGEPTLFDLGKRNVTGAAWHPEGRRVALTMRTVTESPELSALPRVRTSRQSDSAGHVAMFDSEHGILETIHEEGREISAPAWSASGEQLLFIRRSEGKGEPPLFDLLSIDFTDAPRVLLSAASIGSPRPSPVDSTVALRRGPTDGSSNEIVIVDLEGGPVRTVGGELDRPLSDPSWFDEGRRILVSVEDRGNSRLAWIDVSNGGARPLDSPVGASEFPVTDGSFRGACISNESASPPEIWGVDLASGSRRPLTSIQPSAPEGGWGVAEPFELETEDGTACTGWIVVPPVRKGPVGAMLRIGGGLHPMAGPVFSTDAQVLAARGIASLSFNVRGCGGCGAAMADASSIDRFGIPMRDSLRGIDTAVEEFPFLDAARFGLLGVSAGASLAAWIVGHTDRFRTAILDRGTYDLLSYALLSDSPWTVTRTFAANPVDSAPVLWSQSPLRIASRISIPLLLFHGAEDRRSPASQSESFYSALVNGSSELVIYPGAGHDFDDSPRASVRADRIRRIAVWSGKWLDSP